MKTPLEVLIAALKKEGFKVREFTPFHIRIAERFDIFPNEHGRPWAYFDALTQVRGAKPFDQLAKFVPHFLDKFPRPAALPIAKAGWWNCMVCPFKMRDDGTALAARRMLEHLDTHNAG